LKGQKIFCCTLDNTVSNAQRNTEEKEIEKQSKHLNNNGFDSIGVSPCIFSLIEGK